MSSDARQVAGLNDEAMKKAVIDLAKLTPAGIERGFFSFQDMTAVMWKWYAEHYPETPHCWTIWKTLEQMDKEYMAWSNTSAKPPSPRRDWTKGVVDIEWIRDRTHELFFKRPRVITYGSK